MSEIVKLTNNVCQASCREDEMNVQAPETLAPLMRRRRKIRDADAPDQGAAVTTGLGI
jgi:hypothetical protein